MKLVWKKISGRIDALTLRERAMIFAGTAGIVIFMVFTLFLNPSYARQRALLGEMALQRDKIAGVETEIAQTIEAHTVDPDAAERARLAKIRADAQALSAELMAMQQGMVPADRMSVLLERILRSHRGLRLKSLRTLDDQPALAEAASGSTAPAAQLLHRHGVELVVQGSYPDMVAYMSALEGMQGQLFWGSASFQTDTWPNATLTLVAYTINLDKKWLKL